MAEPRHLVGVVWRDAHGSSLSEFAEHEIPHRAFIWTTYGLLMRDDAEGISIANEVSEGSYRGITFVPREMVVEVIDLGVPRRKRKTRKGAASPPAVETAAAGPSPAAPGTAAPGTAAPAAPAQPNRSPALAPIPAGEHGAASATPSATESPGAKKE